MSDERLPRRSLESLKKEAKRWHRALEAHDVEARARFERAYPGAPAVPGLRDVQHALALEHGFPGWPALKQAIEGATSSSPDTGAKARAYYESAALALLDAYRTGTPEAMERHYSFTWHRRAWRAMRTYVQLDLGKRPEPPVEDVDLSLDDARQLVAREHGFANWSELKSFTDSSKTSSKTTPKPLRLVLRKGPDEWETIARSREWDDVLHLLRAHPAAGLSGDGQVTDGMLADLSRVETLTALGLGGCRAVTDDGVRHLASLQRLEHLDLSGTAITDAGVQVLRFLPQLRTLSLAWTRVTGEGLGVLAHCRALEQVNLSRTSGGDAALRALAGHPDLRDLSIELTDAGIPLLHELPRFKEWHGGDAELALLGPRVVPNHLTLRGTFTDAGMQHLRGLDGLYALNVDDGSLAISARGIEPLGSLPHLGALGVDAKDDWMPHIAAFSELRFLGVQDTVAGDEGFVALSRSPSIEYIWGRRCHNLRTPGFVALADMPALRGLAVSCVNVEDSGLAALPAFPSLRELMPMDVPDAGYRHIGLCERLESLILMYCRDTTDAATEHITGLRHLSYYFNSYTTITDRTPELLSTIQSLERVTFDTCHGLTNAGVATLARLPRLREVRVSGNGITPGLARVFPPRVSVVCGP